LILLDFLDAIKILTPYLTLPFFGQMTGFKTFFDQSRASY